VTSNVFRLQAPTQKYEGVARRFFAFVLCSALVITACNLGVSAQTGGAASLRVSVFDPTHASLPNAETTLVNESTGEKRTGTSNEMGIVVFTAVVPDSYTVRVAKSGFRTYEEKNFILDPSATRGLDVSLPVSGASENVTVTSEAPLVTTETSAREDTITARQIENLSIISRSANELLRILPGVVAPDGPDLQLVGFESGSNNSTGYSVNGTRGVSNNTSLDGSRVTDTGTNSGTAGTMITLNPDMVQEVTVQTSNYAAEFGSSGIQITATTKSGGNRFHGEAYDYLRNYAFNANDRSRSILHVPRAKDKYNYPGGNFGGPVLIPGTDFNKNRDKLFFFFGAEVQRQTYDAGASQSRVPTINQRNGIGFQNINNGTPFDLTAGQIDPTGKTLVSLYPMPNRNAPGYYGENYVFAGLAPINRNQEVLRVDYKVNEKTSVFVRLAREYENHDYPQGLWWNTSSYELPTHIVGNNLSRSGALDITSVLNPTLTNELVISDSKLKLDSDYADPKKVSAQALGLQNLVGPFGMQSPYAPVALLTSGDGSVGNLWANGGLPIFSRPATFSITENLTKVKSAHILKFGGLFERATREQNQSSTAEGLFNYGPWAYNSTGDVFADMLAGRLGLYNQAKRLPVGNYRYFNVEGYAQDNFKVMKKLTLEYGLRFGYYPSVVDLNNHGLLFDPSKYDPSQGLLIGGDPTRPNGVLTTAQNQIPRGVIDNPRPYVMPRLGFAWDIFGNGSTVMRGGGGLYYYRVSTVFQAQDLQQPPNSYNVNFFGFNYTGLDGGKGLDYNDIGQLDPYTVLGAIPIQSQNPKSAFTPSVTTMSFSIAHRLPKSTVFEVGYVGSLGRHLPERHSIDFIKPGALLSGTVGNADLSVPVQRLAVGTNGGLLVPFTPFQAYQDVQYAGFGGTSDYHSLQATLKRQTGHLTYLVAYTFSKALGLQSVNESGDLVDPVDPRHRSFGVLPYDRTHVLNVSYSYQLPDGARGSFRNPVTAGVLNGWQVSGITTYSSGLPYRLNFGGELSQGYTAIGFFGSNAYSTSATSSSAIAPAFTANPSRSGTKVGDKILDINALSIPAFGQSGPYVSPFYLRSPNRSNSDFSVFKNFPIGETTRIQFRAGFFNVFNQAYPISTGAGGADINTYLNTNCNVRVDNVPNGSGGTSNGVCDPTQGYHFTPDTLANFGMIQNKHGHRILEFALKLMF
jgi:Carboxypeptidase regulatory-like domain/TonB-dependent Receptor Plug Domain